MSPNGYSAQEQNVLKGKTCWKLVDQVSCELFCIKVIQYKVMETVGNSSYSLVNEEKGVIPHGESRVMGFCLVVMRLLESCWTSAAGQFQQTGAWKEGGLCIWVIYSMSFFTIRTILATKKHFDCYCDAQGATLRLKCWFVGKKNSGVLTCQGLITFTAVATQEC